MLIRCHWYNVVFCAFYRQFDIPMFNSLKMSHNQHKIEMNAKKNGPPENKMCVCVCVCTEHCSFPFLCCRVAYLRANGKVNTNKYKFDAKLEALLKVSKWTNVREPGFSMTLCALLRQLMFIECNNFSLDSLSPSIAPFPHRIYILMCVCSLGVALWKVEYMRI